MKMEGEIISRENIKPSSPTPPHKRNYKLSLIDQILQPRFFHLVLYYPNHHQFTNTPKTINGDDDELTPILKQSLSATLSLFYPFAGRLNDDDALSIDCNDEGAFFVVATFNQSLSDFLKRPDPEACRAHIPGQVNVADDQQSSGSHVAMIQVNYFDCGGIAIGSSLSHKVGDTATIATFMKAWAAAAATAAAGGRGSGEAMRTLVPSYTASTLFPQNESMPEEAKFHFRMRRLLKTGRTVMRRYVFESPAISKLRAGLLPEGFERRPSRVETITAFMWKCFMVASDKFGGDGNNYNYLTHAVNLRGKADPPFPETSIGNFLWRAAVSTVNSQANRDMEHLFGIVRSAISNVDADFVKRMQGEEGLSGHCKNLEETMSHIPENADDGLNVTSWCNFGLYDIDFGWGKPTWITKCDMGHNITDVPFANLLWLMDTRSGDGIEAWLVMDQRYYAEFDKIKELTDLASVDPSPLDFN